MNYLNEARGVASIGKITFTYKEGKLKFPVGSDESSFRNCYLQIYNWLFDNNYNFKNVKNVFNNNGNFYSKDEVDEIIKSGRYQRRLFQKLINSNKYLLVAGNKSQYKENLINMLNDFGAVDIKFEGFESDSKIKKFGEIDTNEEDFDEDVPTQEVEKIKVYQQNPFKQSICVLGDPGAGKSVTIRNVLRNEKHIFQIIEPTATTTGLLSQFSPSKHEYVPSRIGNLLIEASSNPDKLYTVVIDEFHKSNVIEMVNDELKHAISLKRYSGDRFILIDDATEYLKSYLEEDDGGNVMVPDNFGFIFISSKPRVISNNKDIFDRLDVVILTEENRKINTSKELLDLKISEEEKKKLSSSRND